MLRMGEDPSTLTDAEESETATLADRLRLDLESTLAKAILETPRGQLTGWQPLDGGGMRELEDGSVLLPLPDDFLMLHSVRLRGWERAVTEISEAGSFAAVMQGSRWAGLRGCGQRPVAVEAVWSDGSDESDRRCLRLHGAHDTPPALAEGWYMPAPRIDAEGFIELGIRN